MIKKFFMYTTIYNKCLNIIYCFECLHSAITFAESGCAEDACNFFEQIMLKNAK